MERNYDILCMGRALLDLYANEVGVPFAEVQNFAAYVGGCPANICVSARRLGLLLTHARTEPGSQSRSRRLVLRRR